MRQFRLAASIVLAACALAMSSQATDGPRDEGRQSGSPTIAFHAGSSALNIPFRYELGHIILPVQLADSVIVEMLLDTGFGVNGAILLDPALGQALHLQYAGRSPLGGGGTSSQMLADVAPNARLSLPGVTFGGQTLLVVTDAEPYRGYPARGIIGKTVFDCVVEIDYEGLEINLHDAASFRVPEGHTSLETTFTYGIPVVEATIESAGRAPLPVRLIVDTGAVQLLLFPWRTPGAELSERTVAGREGLLSRGFNGIVRGSTGRIDSLRLGPFTWSNVIASFPDSASWGSALVLGQDGMLGNDALRRFSVVFDYAHQRIHLKTNAGHAEPFESDMTGMIWEPTSEGGVAILDLIPGSPATECGIRISDRIVAVDGRVPREIGWAALETLFMAEGARIRLTIVRGGERLEKVLALRRLI